MAKSSKQKKSNIKNIDSHKKNYIFISIIFLSIFLQLSLISSKMGVLGKYCKYYSLGIFGAIAYTIPIIILVISVFLLLKKTIPNLWAYCLILFNLFIIFDLNKDLHLSLKERIQLAFDYGQLNSGGGAIGAFFGYFSYKIFGSLGTYIISSMLILISIFIIFQISCSDIFHFISSLITKKNTKPLKIKGNNLYDEDFSLAIDDNFNNNDSENHSINIQIADSEYNSDEFISTEEELEEPNENINNIEVVENEHINKLFIGNNDTRDRKTNLTPRSNTLNIKIANTPEIKTNNQETTTSNENRYNIPPLSLLNKPQKNNQSFNKEISDNSRIIEETMKNFGIDVKVIAANRGPTITCYELEPAPGVKLNRIVNLSDNLAFSLASEDIRIEAPIPGKSAVGIEIPNKVKNTVLFSELLMSNEYKQNISKTPLALGKDVSGASIISSIEKMPHLLIAGATGAGKSVCINTIIMSIIFKSSPNDVKLILIDPKVVELSVYNGIPHLLIPVVNDPQKASGALQWAVNEMEKRYKLFAKNNVRDINGFNNKVKDTEQPTLPNIIIIIDELADLMMVCANEVEDSIARLAQMARAAGMHLIVATQRPSVDVITGTIKANIPSRISFAVSSQIDSRTILDMAGAEKLLGKGDMLFYPSFYSKPKRIQGAFVSDTEVETVVEYLKQQYISSYNEDVIESLDKLQNIELNDADPLLEDAIEIVVLDEQASISFIQRKLKVGYSRAARIVDQMEERNIVGPPDGAKPRRVLITPEEFKAWKEEKNEK